MGAFAVILASGEGQRFGTSSVPKHLIQISGVPIIVWTLSTAIQSKLFSDIVIVTSKGNLEQTKNIIYKYFDKDNCANTIKVAVGSTSRMQSFILGLKKITSSCLVDDDSVISLLDANRPFTSISQLHNLYDAALEFKCSCPARPVVNGVARVDANNILEVPDKLNFVEFVTPEFMLFKPLNDAINNCNSELSSLVEYALSLGLKPSIIDATILNVKLTFPEDKAYLNGLVADNQLVKPICLV